MHSNDGQNNLFNAVETNDIKTAAVLLQSKAEVNATNQAGEIALLVAAQKGFLEMVQLLLAQDADINSRNAEGETALFKAILFNRFKVVQLLLDRRIEKKMEEAQIKMALFYVSISTSVELVQLLLTFGASLSRVNEKGESAPFSIFQKAKPEVAQLLLSSGMDPDLRTQQGQSLLSNMCRAYTLFRDKKIELLIQYGADVDYREHYPDGQWSLLEQLLRSNRDAYKKEVSLLIRAGATFPSIDRMKVGETQFFASAEAVKNTYYEAIGKVIGKTQEAEITATLKAWPYLSACFIWHKAIRHIENQLPIDRQSLSATEVIERMQQRLFVLEVLSACFYEKSVTDDFFPWLEQIKEAAVPKQEKLEVSATKMADLPQELRDQIISALYQLVLPEKLKQPAYFEVAEDLKPHTASFDWSYQQVGATSPSFRNG